MIKLVMSIELWCDFILEKNKHLYYYTLLSMLEITRFQNILKSILYRDKNLSGTQLLSVWSFSRIKKQ